MHARHIAASNLPENSLQGIVDEDPSEALPSSLAELKSEDGHSNADHKEHAKQAAVAKDEAKLRAAAPSFSSFLHESAAAVDPSMSPSAAPPRHSQQPQHSYSGFPGQGVPQPSPSPIAGYSASQPFSPHLYAQVPQRPMSQQPQHALYPGYPGQAPSPFATQPIHQAYSSSPFAAASPIPPTHGYPSPYRESASPALPHGITNPALIASYSSYGLQPQMAAPGGPGRGYGAVGAIGGSVGPGRISSSSSSSSSSRVCPARACTVARRPRSGTSSAAADPGSTATRSSTSSTSSTRSSTAALTPAHRSAWTATAAMTAARSRRSTAAARAGTARRRRARPWRRPSLCRSSCRPCRTSAPGTPGTTSSSGRRPSRARRGWAWARAGWAGVSAARTGTAMRRAGTGTRSSSSSTGSAVEEEERSLSGGRRRRQEERGGESEGEVDRAGRAYLSA